MQLIFHWEAQLYQQPLLVNHLDLLKIYLKDNDICKCLKLRFRLMLQRDLCFKEDDELPK